MSLSDLSSIRHTDHANKATTVEEAPTSPGRRPSRPTPVQQSSSILDQQRKKAHTVIETFKQVFQDEPEVLESRTIKSVERIHNERDQYILRTVISIHYIGHTDKQWPSWPWSRSPLMHEEMPPEMTGLYSEELYRQHLQETNHILKRYMFNRYPKMLLTLLFVLLIIFIIVIRTVYVWKTVYFAWVFAFALVFLILLTTMRIRAGIGMNKLKKLARQWNQESDGSITFDFNSIDFLYFVRLFITVESQDKQTMDAAETKYLHGRS